MNPTGIQKPTWLRTIKVNSLHLSWLVPWVASIKTSLPQRRSSSRPLVVAKTRPAIHVGATAAFARAAAAGLTGTYR